MQSQTSRRNFRAGGAPGIRFGYTAMIWGAEERQAIDAVTEFKPDELRDILRPRQLTVVALSSGEVALDAPEAGTIAKHAATRSSSAMPAVNTFGCSTS